MKKILVMFEDIDGFEFISNEGFATTVIQKARNFDTVEQAKEYIAGEPEDNNLFKILIIEEIEYE